jgi:hypothetical protein
LVGDIDQGDRAEGDRAETAYSPSRVTFTLCTAPFTEMLFALVTDSVFNHASGAPCEAREDSPAVRRDAEIVEDQETKDAAADLSRGQSRLNR